MRAPSLLALFAIAVGVPSLGIACKKTSVATTTSRERDACNAILETAGNAAAAAEQRVSGSTTCNANEDCVESPLPACVSVGCAGAAVPKSAVSQYTAAAASIEKNDCRRWNEADCAKIAPRAMASCAVYRPACVEHHCRMTNPRPSP